MKTRFLLIVALLTAFCSPAGAWSHKEHIQLTRIAIARLMADPATPLGMVEWLKTISPNRYDMKQEEDFFRHTAIGNTDGKPQTQIEYFVILPDLIALRDRNTKIEPFGVPERLMHFVDLELFVKGERLRGYHHDLSGRPKIEDIPDDPDDARYLQAGVLPFRVRQSYQNLVTAIKANRLTPLDMKSKEPGDDAMRWAGFLAHYLADNTQPHHATIDYKSQSYFADKRSPNVHAEMEYRMADDDKEPFADLREAYWPLFVAALEKAKDPTDAKDLFHQTLQISFESYDALPLIGLAAMKATGQQGTPDAPTGKAGPLETRIFFNFKGPWNGKEVTVMEMKAAQQALAVVRVQKILRQAWDEGTAK